MILLSERAQKLSPSATLNMASKVAKLQARGIDVISFATGEPDFDTPTHIKNAAKRSLDRGCTKYTPSAGIPALREAIAAKLKRENNLDYTTEEITVTCGAKQAIANALLAMVNPGDEVIVPAPYWVSYPAQVTLAGGIPITVDTTRDGMKLTPSLLRRALSKNTKALLLNSPSNPTGMVYSTAELAELAAICAERTIAVISDEIYEHIVYDGRLHTSIVNADPRLREQTVIINGLSKSFAMTGWRLGWAAGPRELISKMTQLAGQQTSCPTSFVQEAAVEALTGPLDEIRDMVAAFKHRRDHMHALLCEIPGLACALPQGTFYLLCNVTDIVGGHYRNDLIESDVMLAEMILTEAHVAAVAGTPFGAPNHLRFSFATSLEQIDEGMKRIKRMLTEIAHSTVGDRQSAVLSSKNEKLESR